MKDLLIVSKFTIKDMVKRKSFIVSNIIFLLVILIGTNIPRIMESFNADDELSRLLLVDEDGLLGDDLLYLEDNKDLGYEIKIIDGKYDRSDAQKAIDNDEYDEIISFYLDKNTIMFDDYQADMSLVGSNAEVIVNQVTSAYYNVKLMSLGLSQDELDALNVNFELNTNYLSNSDSGNSTFAMMMFSIVLFYAVFFCASQVSASVTTEKTSKIIESLTTSTSPKNIVLGKTLGVGVTGLCQLAVLLIFGVICAKSFLPSDVLKGVINLDSITFGVWVIILLYFVLGYALYALIFALTGSLVQKPEDIQSANSPVSMLSVFAFYLAYFSMINSKSAVSVFASLFPFSSPFSMPSRYMLGLASVSDVIISLVILVLTAALIGYISVKVYSNAILNYGNKFSLKDIVKYLKQR
ncbi:MAG: ABC transporter permease [bacterium]|nr:ABC transporter permease [bacterium]